MDYKELGFRCGLELHQQIDGKKLFCNCPCIIRDTEPDYRIKRRLRASASELGTYDRAALHELKKNNYFLYECYNDTNCLVELDEEPPHSLNHEALKIALTLVLLLNAKPVNNMQFMRKVVIDGSNVSGFQRTALIATNGYVETSKGRVRIPTICLEEEAAKKTQVKEDCAVYNLSRLGIPLIEIATETDIHDPEHAKETAETIGLILRSVKGIKRGLGTIRQDVNISIKNGARTEIKGFQDYRNIPKVINYEINRQLELIKGNQAIEQTVRNAKPDFTTEFLRPMPGSARMYPETDIPEIIVTEKLLNEIELPELISEKIVKLEKEFSIPSELARELIKKDIDLTIYAKTYKNIPPSLIARILVESPKEIKSRLNLDITKLKDMHFNLILDLLNKNKLSKDALIQAFTEIISTGKLDIKNYEKAEVKDIEAIVKQIVEKNKSLTFGALMGVAMRELKGKADGKLVAELIRKYL